MPRPKTFDDDKVLAAATFCFWKHGYCSTSMKDLEKATTLTPSSLYNSFGNKDGIFLKSIDHYIDNIVCKRIHKFLETDDPINGIKLFVKDCFEGKSAELSLGCLLINTSTELGPHDQAVRQKVARGMKLVEVALHKAIQRAQDSGQLPQDTNCNQKAIHIGLLMNGMLVNAKVANNTTWLSLALKSIDSILV